MSRSKGLKSSSLAFVFLAALVSGCGSNGGHGTGSNDDAKTQNLPSSAQFQTPVTTQSPLPPQPSNESLTGNFYLAPANLGLVRAEGCGVGPTRKAFERIALDYATAKGRIVPALRMESERLDLLSVQLSIKRVVSREDILNATGKRGFSEASLFTKVVDEITESGAMGPEGRLFYGKFVSTLPTFESTTYWLSFSCTCRNGRSTFCATSPNYVPREETYVITQDSTGITLNDYGGTAKVNASPVSRAQACSWLTKESDDLSTCGLCGNVEERVNDCKKSESPPNPSLELVARLPTGRRVWRHRPTGVIWSESYRVPQWFISLQGRYCTDPEIRRTVLGDIDLAAEVPTVDWLKSFSPETFNSIFDLNWQGRTIDESSESGWWFINSKGGLSAGYYAPAPKFRSFGLWFSDRDYNRPSFSFCIIRPEALTSGPR